MTNTCFWGSLDGLIEEAEAQASNGSGQFKVLYESRVQAAYAGILNKISEGDYAKAEAILHARVYCYETEEYIHKQGKCGLMGS